MNLKKVIALLDQYEKCPLCGCDKIGNGFGSIKVEESYFKRTCKCGYEIVIESENK